VLVLTTPGRHFSYALVDAEGKLVTTQEGVVRTNCIDCLDRTNVVQVIKARFEYAPATYTPLTILCRL
jgi:hypothetical protein